MANKYPLVVSSSSGVIQELQSSDGLELGNGNIANVGNINVTYTANLGAVGNITITGGTTGQVLTTNGSGVVSWGTIVTTPGGSNTQVQYNDAGTTAGSAGMVFNKTSNTFTVAGNLVGGNVSTSGTMLAVGNITGGNFICATGILVLNTELPTESIANGTISLDIANNKMGVYYASAWHYTSLTA